MRRLLVFASLAFFMTSFVHGKRGLDTTTLTLEEALSALQEEIDFTFSIPRWYWRKGAKGDTDLSGVPSKRALEWILEIYPRIHRLEVRRKEKHIDFYRPRIYDLSPYEPPTILEALGAIDRFAVSQEYDLGNFRLISAELSFDRSKDFGGYYWYIVYSKKNSTDGGLNSYHFFVYPDLLVECGLSGRGKGPIRKDSGDLLSGLPGVSY